MRERKNTVNQLLDNTVRGPLRRETKAFDLKCFENGNSIMITDPGSGVKYRDNSAQREAYDWLLHNSRQRGVTTRDPLNKHEGD